MNISAIRWIIILMNIVKFGELTGVIGGVTERKQKLNTGGRMKIGGIGIEL